MTFLYGTTDDPAAMTPAGHIDSLGDLHWHTFDAIDVTLGGQTPHGVKVRKSAAAVNRPMLILEDDNAAAYAGLALRVGSGASNYNTVLYQIADDFFINITNNTATLDSSSQGLQWNSSANQAIWRLVSLMRIQNTGGAAAFEFDANNELLKLLDASSGFSIDLSPGTPAADRAVAFQDEAGTLQLTRTTTLGDLIYHNGTKDTRLAGNITTTKQFLTQTGDGAVSAAPAWGAIATGDVPDGGDATAIHDDVAAEISALTEKATPVSGDWLVIEDSAASDAKKKVQVGNLPGGGQTTILDVDAGATVGNTTTETTVYSKTVTGGTVDTDGQKLRLKFVLKVRCQTSRTVTVRYKLAGTTIESPIFVIAAGTMGLWFGEWVIERASSTTARSSIIWLGAESAGHWSTDWPDTPSGPVQLETAADDSEFEHDSSLSLTWASDAAVAITTQWSGTPGPDPSVDLNAITLFHENV